jgi:hypothetical protein
LQNEAIAHRTKASDQWNYYQSKKNRQYLYEGLDELPTVLSAASGDSETGQKIRENWITKIKKYRSESEEIQKDAKGEEREADKLEEQSHRAHHRADRYDLGELGVELALVLCSLAVLTKRAPFWYSGIGFGILGSCVAITGLFL